MWRDVVNNDSPVSTSSLFVPGLPARLIFWNDFQVSANVGIKPILPAYMNLPKAYGLASEKSLSHA